MENTFGVEVLGNRINYADIVIEEINKAYMDRVFGTGNMSFSYALDVTKQIILDVFSTLIDKCGLCPLIAFSGGKDSTVLLHYMIDIAKEYGFLKEILVIYIEVTGNTHEENKGYVYRIARELGILDRLVHLKSDLDFYKTIRLWGFPSFRRRWCMNVFKRMVLERFIKNINRDVLVFVGDRFYDSPRRRKLLLKKGFIEYNRGWRQYTVHPIAHWFNRYVYRYMELNNIEINPLYKKLGFSGNCIYCPYITSIKYYNRLRTYYPEWYRKIISAEKAMEKGGALFSSNRVRKLYEILGD